MSFFNVIALISGGKDSIFSILHCLANGHQVVALANLYPPTPLSSEQPRENQYSSPSREAPAHDPKDQDEDLNSYMYQTVGHTLLPLIATALSLPLYRQEISGSALNTERDYSVPVSSLLSNQTTSSFDETESLLPLLQHILSIHPSVNAVSTGAILSTYQRTRIESVALRLGLVPLSFLWQYPSLPRLMPDQAALLHDMSTVGLDARIVKVASGGLDESFLWENVTEGRVVARLRRAMGRFGGSVLGEGGEYETLVVKGPKGLWKGSIEVDDSTRKNRRGAGGECTVGFENGTGRLIRRDEDENREEEKVDWKERIRIPSLWDKRFEGLPKQLQEELPCAKVSNMGENATSVPETPQTISSPESVVVRSRLSLTISNLTSTTSSSTEEQSLSIVHKICEILTSNNRSADDIVFTTILLRSMTDFAAINTIYAPLFSKPNPPARVTVACGDALPENVHIMLSVIVDLGEPRQRNGLHVQSRSYWAPANIGPYSQAIFVSSDQEENGSLVYVAGQIPLVPATLTVLETEADSSNLTNLDLFLKQTVLSLQHLWRIGVAMKVEWWTGAIAFISGEQDMQKKAIAAWLAWRAIHKETEPPYSKDEEQADGRDAWDRRYGGQSIFVGIEETVPQLPDFRRAIYDKAESADVVPGFFAVQVDGLPRNCEIEWQSLGTAGSRVRLERFSIGGMNGQRLFIVNSNVSIEYLGIPASTADEASRRYVLDALGLEKKGKSAEVSRTATLYTSRPAVFMDIQVQVVPCRAVWGAEGTKLIAGLVVHINTISTPHGLT
ncbi:hypothetical protein MMC06_005318 [Schaereria dolodes]|nr:hypothetical protein [Schaereria dolodes]